MPGGPIPKTGALAANSGVTETKPGRARACYGPKTGAQT